MISKDYYCPRCGVLWDTVYCEECGNSSDDFEPKTPRKEFDDKTRVGKKDMKKGRS